MIMYWRVYVFHSSVIMTILFLVINIAYFRDRSEINMNRSTIISDDEKFINVWLLLLVKSN